MKTAVITSTSRTQEIWCAWRGHHCTLRRKIRVQNYKAN